MPNPFQWQTASPESHCIDPEKLEAIRKDLAGRGTKGLLIVRNDRIVCEWYAPDHGPEKPHYTASLAKALVGGLSLILALDEGRIGVDDPAWKYIPAWKNDPRKSAITIRHLATHSSGIEDAEATPEDRARSLAEGRTLTEEHMALPGWKGGFWRKDPDPFSLARDSAPVVFPPGTANAYSNPGMAMLGYAVTAALKGSPHPDIRALLKARVMDPIGVPETEWSIGYGRPSEVDGLTLYATWGGGSYTARAVARVGRFMLRKGNWEGRHLVRPEWIEKAVAYAGTPISDRPPGNPSPASGLGWWTNFDGVWSAVPRDAFAGAGAGNQVLLVVPSLDLIVVRNGALIGDPEKGEGFWGGLETRLFTPLMHAIRSPYPRSKTIRGVTFAPPETIVRDCVDSDNFPITWGDDDAQYTAYGDGWGFEPRTEKKLSLGFARVLGDPPDFRAENTRSETGEREGDGLRGAKASGLLMVGGTLYMWARNLDNAQLAWSEDRGRTWEWGFRFTTSFGCPTLLNFGPNYAGARDDYVYTYSSDGPSAYEAYDHMVLARVPKDRIRDRNAYEFLQRVDDGRPHWTPDIDARGPVFIYPGRCQRADVVHHPGLGRYLLLLGHNHDGAWGIYEAPEPWGPWSEAFHTVYWGLGETHYYRLPSKWIRGSTGHLVFSGRTHNRIVYDAFCVRKFELDVP